jgi:hypothetical protein
MPMPTDAALLKSYARTGDPDAFRQDKGIHFPIGRARGADGDTWQSPTWGAYGITGIPAAVLIDAEGKVSALAEAHEIPDLLEGLEGRQTAP